MEAIDPVTAEIIRYRFISAAHEMKINLAHSGYNPVVFEMYDLAVGIFDAQANMIAQAPGLPVFLGTLRENVKVITEDIGGLEQFRPGDIYLTNDPYAGGTHLLDVTCVAPVFYQDEVAGFSVAKVHWVDVGGKDAGSYSNDTTNIYQEGLRLRSVKLYDAGKPLGPVFEIIKQNVRLGESVLGDLRAQVAACRTGAQRFQAILERYGSPVVFAAKKWFMNHAEHMARLAVQRIPDGRYQAEGWLDNDGLRPRAGHLRIKVTVTVEGDGMTVDLTGSQRQNEGPINCGLAATASAVRVGFKCVTTPWVPINEGSFRPLSVVVPEDSMYNAKYPAPCCLFGRHLLTMIDTFLKALAPVLPGKIPAGHYCDLGVLSITGTDPRSGSEFVHVDSSSGGWGASEGIDGESCLIAIQDGDSKNVPAELLEQRYPLRLQQFGLREDSGGAGKFRGGLGHVRDFLVLADGVRLLTSVERHGYHPWGIFGGFDGMSNDAIQNRAGRRKQVRKVTAYLLRRGDVLSMRSGGGGGYKPPRERNPASVLSDVIDGYVSQRSALRDYACVIRKTGKRYRLDAAATEKARARLRQRSGRKSTGKGGKARAG
jgi:N-methylhydantoinase B